MPRFTYSALTAGGSEEAGALEAASVEQAIAGLKARGLFPTGVVPAGMAPDNTTTEPRSSRRSWQLPFVSPVSARERATFTRQLATLLRAGMPLLRALETLARQEKNRALKSMLDVLAVDIRSGETLSEAMAQHPRIFDRLTGNMVKAGEAGGALEAVLDRLAKFQEQSLRLRGKIRAAMIYPLIVLGVAMAILVGLLVFVVPKFQRIFADLLKGAPLPPLTQAVLAVSNLVKTHYPFVLLAGVAVWLLFQVVRKTIRGQRLIDGAVLRMPIVGELLRQSITARFSRTLGTLLASGVPILPALTIARDTCGNIRMADAIEHVHERVKGGEPVARPLEGTRVFPPMVTSMIDVGEHTGQLPEMLGRIADIYDEEVDNTVAGLSSLIEPMLIVFLALVVGTIVIALFLPIVRIVQLMT